MDTHITLSLQALFAPLFFWLPATPAFAHEDIWLVGVILGLVPAFHTMAYSPMGLMVRSIRTLCQPLDQPAGIPKRNGLTAALMAAGLWGGGGLLIFWIPLGGAGGLGSFGLLLHGIIIASLCNVSAVPIRALQASRLAYKNQIAEAREILQPLTGGLTQEGAASAIHRRALEAMVIWFVAGVTGGSIAYLVFGLPGLLAYTAIRIVARYVDRHGYNPEQATGPVVLEAITGYAAGCLAGVLLAIASLTAPGTNFGHMMEGLRRGISFYTRGRSVRLRRMALGPALSVVTYAFHIQLMGPGTPHPNRTASDSWIGPQSGTLNVTHSDVLRGTWLLFIALLLLIVFGASLRVLALSHMPFFGPQWSLWAL